MSSLESILSDERILCRAACSSKKRALELLAELIAGDSRERTAGVQDQSVSELFELLIARERLGSTGIGNGIAIPHCRCAGLDRAVGAVITLENGIDFDAVDGAPVDIIFAMVVPQDGGSEHLQRLAVLAEALQTPGFVASLRSAETPAQLFAAARAA